MVFFSIMLLCSMGNQIKHVYYRLASDNIKNKSNKSVKKKKHKNRKKKDC